MNKSKIAKIAGLTVGMTLALGASTAGAVTIAELQAQINALMAQLATLQGTTVSTGTAITSNLTIGSTGAEVSALQSALVAQGHLVMPAGVAMGYFGSLTKAAVAKWQAANGVAPAVGYFGPLSRAKFNASVSVGGTVPGTTVGSGTTVGGGITTPGVEGSITVSVNPSPAAGIKLYEGESMKQVMGIKLEAKTSDIKIERLKIDLDSVTNTGDNLTYTKIAQKIYVMDGSTVLASSDLNADTVVKDGANYFITLSGLSYVVPKDATRVLYIALDARSSWDSTYDNDTWSLGLQVDGARGIDGAGVNQYGPSTAFTREFTSAADLVDSASLVISLASNSPETNQVICDKNTDSDECDELTLLVANFKAEKDDVTITDLVASITRSDESTDTATATTAYLYDGSTLIGSAAVAGTTVTAMSATFSDIDYVVPKDTTKVLTVKLDIRDSGLTKQTFTVAISGAANVTAENSAGTAVVESGSATSKVLTIRKVGPQITLVSKSITTSGVPQSDTSNSLSTSTMTATFNIKVKAVGGDITLGTVASGTPTFASSTTSFKVYRNGSYDGTITAGATSTSYSIDSTCAVGSLTNSCVLSEGTEVTVPVTFSIIGRTVLGVSLTRGSVYSVQFEGIQWFNDTTGAVQTTTFMSGLSDWRTADVSFP